MHQSTVLAVHAKTCEVVERAQTDVGVHTVTNVAGQLLKGVLGDYFTNYTLFSFFLKVAELLPAAAENTRLAVG